MITFNAVAIFILVSASIYWIWRKSIEWFKEDEENNYKKSDLEKAIDREVHLSQYSQYSDKYPPPTFPEDL